MDTRTLPIIDGIEEKQFFNPQEQRSLLNEIEKWFESVKGKFPKVGIFIYAPRESEERFVTHQAIELPPSVVTLLNAMLKDAELDKRNASNPIVKVLLERTGSKWSNPEDIGYHVDTNKVLFDKNWNRIGYDTKRGMDKYMAFIGRPGSFVIQGKIDKNLTHPEAIKIANQYHLDPHTGETLAKNGAPKPKIIQLDSDKIYKVSVGDLMHGPPPHEDGLLITLSLVDDIPYTMGSKK